MSWLARSIANTLRLDDDDDDGDDNNDSGTVDLRDDDVCNPRYGDVVDRAASSISQLHPLESQDLEEVDLEDRVDIANVNDNNNNHHISESNDGDDYDYNNQGRGMREDLSEFRETLTRQLWGVAKFLAPPPPPPPPLPRRNAHWLELDRDRRDGLEGAGFEEEEEEEEDVRDREFGEVRRDFLEMGAVMQEEQEEEEDLVGDAVGITDEVLAFAQNIAHHPETWLDFPLSEEEDFDDFEISDTQHKHCQAIECLAPRLAALRMELCPAHLTKGYFWMVYFVLLHSRLNKHDADLLSTPQLVKARVMWVQELQKQTKEDNDWLGLDTFHPKEKFYFPHADTDSTSCDGTTPRYVSHAAYSLEPMTTQMQTDYELEKHPIECSEVQFIDKSVIEEDPADKRAKDSVIGPSYIVPPVKDFDEDSDDWLADDTELEGYMENAINMVNEEDVSFSDLEDDTDYTLPIKSKTVAKDWRASPKAL